MFSLSIFAEYHFPHPWIPPSVVLWQHICNTVLFHTQHDFIPHEERFVCPILLTLFGHFRLILCCFARLEHTKWKKWTRHIVLGLGYTGCVTCVAVAEHLDFCFNVHVNRLEQTYSLWEMHISGVASRLSAWHLFFMHAVSGSQQNRQWKDLSV